MTCCDKDLELLRKTFRPNFNFKLLAAKFYARHDNEVDDPEILERIPYFMNEIDKKKKYDMRKERLAPVTENQMYGWLERKAIRCLDPIDNYIFNHNFKSTQQMRDEKMIQVQSKIFGRR